MENKILYKRSFPKYKIEIERSTVQNCIDKMFQDYIFNCKYQFSDADVWQEMILAKLGVLYDLGIIDEEEYKDMGLGVDKILEKISNCEM